MINKIWKINKINYLTLTSFLCLFSTFLILYWVLKFSAYGIDFTDEGYYLNWISNPSLYKISVSQFGFIYHPLYNLVDGNIVWLRRLNAIIIFTLSFTLTYLLINKIIEKEKINRILLIIISICISIYSLTCINIQTPSYNYLNFQGLLLTSIGLVLIDEKNFNKNFFAHIVIGLGGWLTFMAKPTSALGLTIIISIYLFLSKNFRLRFILVSIFTSSILLILSALIIDGSISLFFDRYLIDLEKLSLLQSRHGLDKIFRIDNFNLPQKIKYLIFFIFLFFLFFIFFEIKNYKITNFLIILISFLIFLTIILLTLFDINLNPNFGRYRSYILFGILFAFIFTNIFFIIKKKIKINEIQWSIFVLFLVLPYVFALGTGNNYWEHSGSASFFWLLASLTIIMPIFLKFHKKIFIIFFVITIQLITSVHIQERMEKPYRYNEPLRLSESKIYVDDKYYLKLSKEFSNYINDFRNIVTQSGFKKNDPIIDLSGQSPTLVYLINGKSIGTAWNIGGYKGSLELAKAKFDLVHCKEISNAWIILETKGRRSISIELLNYLGADFPNKYQLMGSWKTAKGAGGYKNPRKQELYKPTKSELIFNSCNKTRKQNN